MFYYWYAEVKPANEDMKQHCIQVHYSIADRPYPSASEHIGQRRKNMDFADWTTLGVKTKMEQHAIHFLPDQLAMRSFEMSHYTSQKIAFSAYIPAVKTTERLIERDPLIK